MGPAGERSRLSNAPRRGRRHTDTGLLVQRHSVPENGSSLRRAVSQHGDGDEHHEEPEKHGAEHRGPLTHLLLACALLVSVKESTACPQSSVPASAPSALKPAEPVQRIPPVSWDQVILSATCLMSVRFDGAISGCSETFIVARTPVLSCATMTCMVPPG